MPSTCVAKGTSGAPLTFLRQEWLSKPSARDTVVALYKHVIKLFTPKRCMFASNFPGALFAVLTACEACLPSPWCTVERFLGADMVSLLALFEDVASDLTGDEREDLFHSTAARVYRINKRK